MSQYLSAANFGGAQDPGFSVEQTNAVLLPDPLDEDATPFRRRQVRALCPEHRLLMALLETACHLVVSMAPHRRRTSLEWQEAHTWIFSDADHAFSFVYACQHLDIDYDMRRMREEIRRRIAANDRRPLLIQSRSAERKRGSGRVTKRPYYPSPSRSKALLPAGDGLFKQSSTD